MCQMLYVIAKWPGNMKMQETCSCESQSASSLVGKSCFEGHFQGKVGPISRGMGQLAVQPHGSLEVTLVRSKMA